MKAKLEEKDIQSITEEVLKNNYQIGVYKFMQFSPFFDFRIDIENITQQVKKLMKSRGYVYNTDEPFENVMKRVLNSLYIKYTMFIKEDIVTMLFDKWLVDKNVNQNIDNFDYFYKIKDELLPPQNIFALDDECIKECIYATLNKINVHKICIKEEIDKIEDEISQLQNKLNRLKKEYNL